MTGDGWFDWPVVARIWQTVDLERTIADLGLPTEPLADDELLGARGVLVRPAAGAPVAILEPSTEGRLAGSLARHGERDAGAYLAPGGGFGDARRAGLELSPVARGPFGRSALAERPDRSGREPFIVLVEPPAATIGG